MFGRDGTNEFLNDYRFTCACATKDASLAAFSERRDEINDFDACFKDLKTRGLLCERRR